MAIINARSPYFISISDSNIYYSLLEINIWEGSSASVSQANTTYNLKKYISTDETKVTFEISELIRDELDTSFNGEYPSAQAQGLAKWVKTSISKYDSSNTIIGGAVVATTLAVNGYSYFEEGSSFTMANESLFVSESDIFIPKFGDSNIAIYTGNSPTVLLLDSAGATVGTSVFAPSVQSANQIKYVSLYPQLITNLSFDDATDWTLPATDVVEDGVLYLNGGNHARTPNTFTATDATNYIVSFDILTAESGGLAFFAGTPNVSGYLKSAGSYSFQFTKSATGTVSFFSNDGFIGTLDNVSVKEVYDVSRIKVTDDNRTNTVDVIQVKDSKFEDHKVTFVNKNGTYEDMYFFLKVTDKLTTKRESYNSNTITASQTYSINKHTIRDFNVKGSSTTKLSSGYLNESNNEKFKQLLLSEKVWITRTFNNSELVLPINIKTSSIDYKTTLNDKLVEYSIDFEDSYNAINDIR